MRRMRSSFTLSKERRSPSSRAMRACSVSRDSQTRHEHQRRRTHPHLRPLDLPLVSVSFISPPLCLEKVQDARKREILTTLGRQWDFGRLWALLLLGPWLLALLQLVLLDLEVWTQHGKLDLLVVL